ncbi:recombinase family protein [Salmonella enterica]|nr:recombinase family protein [Salmonella enterica]
MCRIFAYCRVSTSEQTTENQIKAIAAAGYEVEPQRVISETVSGGVPAMQRKDFADLVNHKMEAGDVLVVLKIDRLGRDSMDIQSTIELLRGKGIKLVSLDLPEPDLSKPGAKMIMQMFSAFAEFERGKIIERTKDGLARARAQGKKLGRPAAEATAQLVQKFQAEGMSQNETARETGLSLRTVQRHWIREDKE